MLRLPIPTSKTATTAGALTLAWAAGVLEAPPPPADGASPSDGVKVDFLRDVRPILAHHCFQCHGPDDAKRKANLRLDSKEEVFAKRKGKHVVEPGSLDGSLVFERLTTENEKKRMPPPGKAEPLTEAQVGVLRAWIEQGAAWTEHWAFVPPRRHEPPEVKNAAWVRDPIDAFVLARLEKENLAPAEEATREAWLRRASFDLTGLPPTIQEIDEFVKDSSPGAYEAQVDRLLASPRYGERQAQEWLDLARYADTSGYQSDTPRTIWKWREWVVHAYNSNKPFDEFTVEQLAGDMLPNATLEQKVATGFNRNHPTNSEAGEEEDEYRSAYVIDRVNTTATVWMGLTLACVQCHDHKYDPISQRDYYSFYSFFNNVKERDSDGFGRNPRPSIPVPNPDQAPRLEALTSRIKALEKRLEADDPLTDVEQAEWEQRMREKIAADVTWTVVEPIGLLSRNGSILKKLDDGSILATGTPPVKDTYEIVVQPGKRKITALRLEAIPDESLPKKSSGRATDGRFILSNIEIRNTTLSESQEPPMVVIARGDADINQKYDPLDIEVSYDDAPGSIGNALEIPEPKAGEDPMGNFRSGSGWSLAGDARREKHEVVLLPRDVLDLNEASILRVSLHHTSSMKFKAILGRFRLSYTEDEKIRKLLLPVLGKTWHSIGPFPAEDADRAFETAFAPEADIAKGLDTHKSYPKVVLAAPAGGGDAATGAGFAGSPGGVSPPGLVKEMKPEGKDAAPEAGKESADVKSAEGAAKPPGLLVPKAPEKPRPKAALAAESQGSDGAAVEGPASAPADGTEVKGPFGAPGKGKKGAKLAAERTEGAPDDVATGPEGAKEKDDDDEKSKDKTPRKKPEKITWTEQHRWRDGSSARLEGKNVAYYLTRKVVADGPRVAKLQIDGPTAVKVWLNGELVHSSAPAPPPMPKKKATPSAPPVADAGKENAGEKKVKDPKDAKDLKIPVKNEVKDKDKPKETEKAKEKSAKEDDEEDEGPEFDALEFFEGNRNPKDDKSFKLGFRAGENELVVKVVYGGEPAQGRRAMGGGMFVVGPGMGGPSGGGSFSFLLTPEGDDVLNHEVITALRRQASPEALTHSRPAPAAENSAPAAVSSAAVPQAVRQSPDGGSPGTMVPAAEDEPKTAPKALATREGKVGEIAIEQLGSFEKEKASKPKLTPAEQRAKVIREYYRTHVSFAGKAIYDEVQRLKAELAKLKREIPETMVMEEREKPRQAYIFKRGLYKNRGENVSSDVPAVLPPMPSDLPKNRLGLARWLTSREHPLTARVTVNRIWRQYFGTGLVSTTEDFGVRGELPSHPELLDTLAVDFMEGKWDMKALHRRIVLSAAYRQASVATPEKLERDPENRLVSRGPRLRLTAEMVRDNALYASGLLVEKIGGESVRPYQPAGISPVVTGDRGYRRQKDEKQYRRSLYVHWKRGAPYPSMLTFDAAKRDTCVVSRPETTTPMQALVLLNDPVYVECAKMLGQRLLKGGGKTDEARLAFGFRICTSRVPTETELAILTRLLKAERAHYKLNIEAAKKLLAVGDAKVDETLDAAELAAWTNVASALLNLDAAIHRG